MRKYRVIGVASIDVSTEVEARNEKEAIRKATAKFVIEETTKSLTVVNPEDTITYNHDVEFYEIEEGE